MSFGGDTVEKVGRGNDNTSAKLQTNALPLEAATVLSPYRVEGNQLIRRRLGRNGGRNVFFTFGSAFDSVFMRRVEFADGYLSSGRQIKGEGEW